MVLNSFTRPLSIRLLSTTWQNQNNLYTITSKIMEKVAHLYFLVYFSSIKDFLSKYDQIRSFLQIWSHLLKKSLMENFILMKEMTSWVIVQFTVSKYNSTSLYVPLICKCQCFFYSQFFEKI